MTCGTKERRCNNLMTCVSQWRRCYNRNGVCHKVTLLYLHTWRMRYSDGVLITQLARVPNWRRWCDRNGLESNGAVTTHMAYALWWRRFDNIFNVYTTVTANEMNEMWHNITAWEKYYWRVFHSDGVLIGHWTDTPL